MSFSETVFLFVLALVIFGPKKLPEIARFLAKTLGEFRRASNEFKSQIEQEIAHLEVESKQQTILAPSSAPENTASRTLSAALGDGETASSPVASAEAPATLAASSDETAPMTMPTEPATEALSPEAVASPTTQESHA